eukprot:Hpha_TRINITY_DN5983_c0_g1::TRINITY_DN5983_c0_g1_i1::g.147218::m.147218
MAHDASDPYGSAAWQQRVSKEMGSAVQAHRARKGHAQMPARNPITHQEYAYEQLDAKSAARVRKDREFRERLQQLERTLSQEKAGREVVQRELENLKQICREQFGADKPPGYD